MSQNAFLILLFPFVIVGLAGGMWGGLWIGGPPAPGPPEEALTDPGRETMLLLTAHVLGDLDAAPATPR